MTISRRDKAKNLQITVDAPMLEPPVRVFDLDELRSVSGSDKTDRRYVLFEARV